MTRVSFIAAIAAAAGIANASDLYLQDFESSSGYSTSVMEFSDGSNDYFTRITDGSNISGGVSYNNIDGAYFGGQDLDGEGASPPLFLTSDSFSISGATNLMFSVDLAEDDASNGDDDWDTSDFVRFEYSVDNGAWMEMLNVTVTSNEVDGVNGYAEANGTEISDTFAEFGAALYGVTGSTMQIRVVWQMNAGDEDLAIDNLRIFGDVAAVPLPPAAFAGLGMLGLMAGAKLRRK